MDVAITRMSSKGQIVIPVELRKGLVEGEKLLIIRNDNHIIMKKASNKDTCIHDDLEFARRTEAAWKSYENGEFKSMPADKFLKRNEKMVNIDFSDNFAKLVKKVKNHSIKEKIKKHIAKIMENPEVGKPMMYGRKDTREVYVGHYRLSYVYITEENKVVLLDLYHKDEQ